MGKCDDRLDRPDEITYVFHPVHFRYPNEIAKAFHGAGRTGRAS